jgi:lipopolysaccharide assembly protein A
MGSFYLILGLICSLLIAIVALANNETVTVSYIFGRAEVSLILLIFGSAFFGALIMGLFSLFRAIRNALAFRESRHQQDALQKQVRQLEEEALFLKAELSRYSSIPDETETELETETEKIEPNELEAPGYRVETALKSEVDEDR